jgi:hypothetical protein
VSFVLGLVRWRGSDDGLPTYSSGAIGVQCWCWFSCLRMFESRQSKGGLEVGHQEGWTTPRRLLRHVEIDIHDIVEHWNLWHIRTLIQSSRRQADFSRKHTLPTPVVDASFHEIVRCLVVELGTQRRLPEPESDIVISRMMNSKTNEADT